MSNEKQKEQEELEDVVITTGESLGEEMPDLDFSYDKIDFDGLDEEGKKEAFKKVSMQNLMVLEVLKGMEGKIKELEEKAVSRVSEEQYQRLLADFENHKKRTQNTSSTFFLDGKLEVLKQLLPLLDNFERGIAMITDENSKKAMEMMQKSCMEIMAENKIEEINPVGEDFNPELHNAVMQEPTEDESLDDKITEVFQKGYKKESKVLRYAQVKVAKI